MAKAFKADLTASTFTHSLKGYYFTSWLGRAVWKKSPPNGFSKHPAQVWNRQQFGLAAQMAASPIWLDYVGALAASKGTEQVPRDVLMMAIYGGLFQLVLPDGTVTTQANHSYQPPQPVKEKSTMIVAAYYDDAYTISSRSSGYEAMGGDITFGAKTTVTHLTMVIGQSNTWDCTIWIVKMDASLKITEIIQQTPAGTFPAARAPIRIEHRATYEKGDKITIIAQRTSGSGGNSFFVPTSGTAHWLYPMTGGNVIDVPGNVVAVGVTCRSRYATDTIAVAFEVENA